MWAWSLSDPFSSGGNLSAAGLRCVSSSRKPASQFIMREGGGGEHQREAFSSSRCRHFQRKSNPWTGKCQSCRLTINNYVQTKKDKAHLHISVCLCVHIGFCVPVLDFIHWQQHFRVICKLYPAKISLNSWSPPPVTKCVSFSYSWKFELHCRWMCSLTLQAVFTFITQTVNVLCAH